MAQYFYAPQISGLLHRRQKRLHLLPVARAKTKRRSSYFYYIPQGGRSGQLQKLMLHLDFCHFFIDLTSFLPHSLSKFNLNRFKKFNILQTKFSKGTSNLKTKLSTRIETLFLEYFFFHRHEVLLVFIRVALLENTF